MTALPYAQHMRPTGNVSSRCVVAPNCMLSALQLPSSSSRYRPASLVGRGRFGEAHLAYRVNEEGTASPEPVCIKRIPLQAGSLPPGEQQRRIDNEVAILSALQFCPEVVRLHGVYQGQGCVDIVMEYCSGGSLDAFQQAEPLAEEQAAAVLVQVLHAIQACHSCGIAFGDLKPANILLRTLPAAGMAPDIALCDFGCAQYTQAGRASRSPGTPLYAAPEVFRQQNGQAADLWSCGVLLYHMLQGGARYPFFSLEGPELALREAFRRIAGADIDFSHAIWRAVSPDAQDLIARMLERDPTMRITAQEALAHPWLQQTASTTLPALAAAM